MGQDCSFIIYHLLTTLTFYGYNHIINRQSHKHAVTGERGELSERNMNIETFPPPPCHQASVSRISSKVSKWLWAGQQQGPASDQSEASCELSPDQSEARSPSLVSVYPLFLSWCLADWDFFDLCDFKCLFVIHNRCTVSLIGKLINISKYSSWFYISFFHNQIVINQSINRTQSKMKLKFWHAFIHGNFCKKFKFLCY